MAPDFYILKLKTIPILDLYMVITMKKTVLFLMVIFLMIGVCGCGMKGQDKVNRMVAYINNKYANDSFAYKSMAGGHLGSNVTKIIVTSEKYPEKSIRVICSEVEGTEVFSDTYLNIKYEDQTRNYIKEVLTAEFGANVYLNYIPSDVASENNGTSDTTFAEYIADENTFITFSAVVCGEVVDEIAMTEKIKAMFSEAVLCGAIYFADEDGMDFSGESGKLAAQKCIEEKNYNKKLYFIKKTVNDYAKTEWTDGK